MECQRCHQRESHRQVCSGDGKVHHHGMVHLADGSMARLCNDCMVEDRAAWDAKRKAWADA